jgi:hypothetical protein
VNELPEYVRDVSSERGRRCEMQVLLNILSSLPASQHALPDPFCSKKAELSVNLRRAQPPHASYAEAVSNLMSVTEHQPHSDQATRR